MQKEIEVKYRVKDLAVARQKLIELGCSFSEPVIQDDTIFINYNRPFIEFVPGDIFLRIRQSNDKAIFTFKQGEEMNSIERETVIENSAQLEDILGFLGFRPVVRVRKSRSKSRYEPYEVCLDEVESLGSFIELEEITEASAHEVQAKMQEFLQSLGIKDMERVHNGYDTLMWLKEHPEFQKIRLY